MKDFKDFKSSRLSGQLRSYSEPEEIGWGSQKKVLRALDRHGNLVALKLGRYRSPKQLERVQREVDFLCGLKHPQFPKHHGFSYDVATREFLIIEEFIIGKNLAQCPLLFRTPLEVLALLRGCCTALKPAWDGRVVHRDLKPDNIMIRERGREPVIIDFGIARFLDHSSLTDTSADRGPCTPIYAAREQLTNRKVEIDFRTDLFAMGVIAAELLFGQHPFSPDVVGNEEDIVDNIINGHFFLPVVAGPSHPATRDLLFRLIDEEPYKRPRSAEELVRAIDSILIGK